MSEDHTVGVIVQFSQGYKSAALFYRVGAWHLEALRVGKHTRSLLLHQDSLFAPGLEVASRPRIYAFPAFGIEEFRQTEDDADQIKRAALVVSLLHGRGDFVIRLGDYGLQPDSTGIVSPRSEGIDVGHAERLAPWEKGGDSANSVLNARKLP